MQLIDGLQQATVKELAEIEILGAGSGLYWPQLAVDIGVDGLLTGNIGGAQSAKEHASRNEIAASNHAAASFQNKPNGQRKNLPAVHARKRQRAA